MSFAPRLGSLEDLCSLNLNEAVIVSPSDTVFGFHARFSSSVAREKIETLKNRTGNFIVLVPSLEAATKLCVVNKETENLLKKYWPGAITFVLRAKTRIEFSSDNTLAVRYPKNQFCIDMIRRFEEPILSTSCNRHGEPIAGSIQEAVNLFGNKVDLYIDGKTDPKARPSTLVDLTAAVPKILRQGDIQFQEGQP